MPKRNLLEMVVPIRLEYPIWIAVFWILIVAAITTNDYAGLTGIFWNAVVVFLGLATAFAGGYEYAADVREKTAEDDS